jgi:competence protein ComEA
MMIVSLLVKLAMLAATMSVVVWIGWTVPQVHSGDPDRGVEPEPGEIVAPPSAASEAVAAGSPGPLLREPRGSTEAGRRSVADRLDLNRATEQDFESLPGIGPVLAERIVEFRRSRGAFRDVGQLRNVKGIGKKKFDRIRTLVSVEPPAIPSKGGRKTT